MDYDGLSSEPYQAASIQTRCTPTTAIGCVAVRGRQCHRALAPCSGRNRHARPRQALLHLPRLRSADLRGALRQASIKTTREAETQRVATRVRSSMAKVQ